MNDFEKYSKGYLGISSLSLYNYSSIFNSYGSAPNPVVLEERELKATAVDVFSRLMMDRIIVVGTPLYEECANIIMSQLLFLNTQDNSKPIQMYINSPGGLVSSGLQIYDTMQMIKAPVHTICTGQAASMATILLAGGEPGKRAALPNSEIMIHQVIGGAHGQLSDMKIATEHMQKLQDKLSKILAVSTGKNQNDVLKDMDRDYWMTPEEAMQYGVIDKVFTGKSIL